MVNDRITADYAVTGWRKAFRVIYGEHFRTRMNVIEPGCVRHLVTGICLFDSIQLLQIQHGSDYPCSGPFWGGKPGCMLGRIMQESFDLLSAQIHWFWTTCICMLCKSCAIGKECRYEFVNMSSMGHISLILMVILEILVNNMHQWFAQMFTLKTVVDIFRKNVIF
jgi:hypothetical protein